MTIGITDRAKAVDAVNAIGQFILNAGLDKIGEKYGEAGMRNYSWVFEHCQSNVKANVLQRLAMGDLTVLDEVNQRGQSKNKM